MKKKNILILLVLVSLSSILFINLRNKCTAQECKDCNDKNPIQIPTPPGNADFRKINCNCTGSIPTIKASATTITPGGSITLWVDSGGKACPDFTWSVSSAKYSLNKSKTMNDLEKVAMTAASGTCNSGYNNGNVNITVTVTDRCGITGQTVIRNTSGKWVDKSSCSSGWWFRYDGCTKIEGNTKYRIEWWVKDHGADPRDCATSAAAHGVPLTCDLTELHDKCCSGCSNKNVDCVIVYYDIYTWSCQ